MSSYAYAWHGSTLLLLGGVDASWWFSVERDAHRGLRRPRLGHGPSWRLGQGIHHSAWVSAFAFGPAVHHGTAELVAMWQSGFTWRGPWTATDPLWLLSLLPCMPCTTRARAPPARAALREGAEGDAHLWHGRPIFATHRRCVECVIGRAVQRQRLGLEPRTRHESVGFHSMGMARRPLPPLTEWPRCGVLLFCAAPSRVWHGHGRWPSAPTHRVARVGCLFCAPPSRVWHGHGRRPSALTRRVARVGCFRLVGLVGVDWFGSGWLGLAWYWLVWIW